MNTPSRVTPLSSGELWSQLRANLLQANQANTGDCIASVHFRLKARGQVPLHDIRIDAEVGEDASSDEPLQSR
jgi:hypothetical protein